MKKKVAQTAAAKVSQKMPNNPPGKSVPCPASNCGEPQFPERAIICEVICKCNLAPKISATGNELKQICVSESLKAYDGLLGNRSTIKPEIPYDMTPPSPPRPIMSRSNPLKPTEYLPYWTKLIPNFKPKTGMVRRPDVVIVKDPTQPPIQSNLRFVVEIKFPPDKYSKEQQADYETIAGDDAELVTLGPDECKCKEKQRQPEPKTVPVVEKKPQEQPQRSLIPKPGLGETIVLGVALAALVLDDLLPTGATQADDLLIPGIIARLGMAF